MSVLRTIEYRRISAYYNGKVAKRSGLPYMKHIDDGLKILEALGAARVTKKAWCLHALIQSDVEFVENLHLLERCDAVAVALAIEYRHTANAYLSRMPEQTEPKTGVSSKIRQMLIADKIQNYHDLITHNMKHPRYWSLCGYFNNWLNALLCSVPGEVDRLMALLDV